MKYTPPKEIHVWLREDEDGIWFVKEIMNPEDPKHKNKWNGRTISEADKFEVYELKKED